MDTIRVQGGIQLQGKVRIQGSKNAILPIMAASLAVPGEILLRNCPRISDVYDMIRLLEQAGCRVAWDHRNLRICSRKANAVEFEGGPVAGMRSSVLLLGAMLARFGRARLDFPGGCVIGARPVDLHIRALEQMGVEFEQGSGQLLAKAKKGMHSAKIRLPFPSVGATENILIAAVTAKGETVLEGAAKEPEIGALCRFLIRCGALIEGVGSSRIHITGVEKLRGAEFRIPADRIVAGTYLLAGFAAGGSLYLEEAPAHELGKVLDVARRMGAVIACDEDGIYGQFPRRAGRLCVMETEVYPGFPTDLQSVLLAVRSTGVGECLIKENLFENRFRIVEPLLRMGADIRQADEKTVLVRGVERLQGRPVTACELRGAAALAVAALGAEGETQIAGKKYLDRGYENICRDLRELGARIISD